MKTLFKIGAGMVLLLFLILAGLYIYDFARPVPPPGHDYYTHSPEPWIEENIFSEDKNDVRISTKRATRNKGVFDGSRLEYAIDGKRITLFYHGMYQGKQFQGIYFSKDYDQDIIGPLTPEDEGFSRYALMTVSPIMDPDDGVINAFVLAKEENESFVFYLFVDEDWKTRLSFTNIIWGDDLHDASSLQIRPFDFSNKVRGIYIDKITTASFWLRDSPRKGGVYIGDITLDTISKDTNQTSIYIR